MRQDFTSIVMVIDRSGSMSRIREEAENGVNRFIEEQKKLPGHAELTICEFDDRYEFFCKHVDIQGVKKYTLSPRGFTALFDAIGRAINETGEHLAAMQEQDRPGLVVFCIVTDGQENASGEFTSEQIKEMIELQQRDYNWQFTFLGADQNAFSVAQGMGISAKSSAQYDLNNVGVAYIKCSANLSRMRSAAMRGQPVLNEFTEEELREMKS